MPSVVGDGENVIMQLAEGWMEWKNEHRQRQRRPFKALVAD